MKMKNSQKKLSKLKTRTSRFRRRVREFPARACQFCPLARRCWAIPKDWQSALLLIIKIMITKNLRSQHFLPTGKISKTEISSQKKFQIRFLPKIFQKFLTRNKSSRITVQLFSDCENCKYARAAPHDHIMHTRIIATWEYWLAEPLPCFYC